MAQTDVVSRPVPLCREPAANTSYRITGKPEVNFPFADRSEVDGEKRVIGTDLAASVGSACSLVPRCEAFWRTISLEENTSMMPMSTAKVRLLQFKYHSDMASVLITTFKIFTRVSPDNSLERLTECSVGLVTDRPGDVYELFVTLLE